MQGKAKLYNKLFQTDIFREYFTVLTESVGQEYNDQQGSSWSPSLVFVSLMESLFMNQCDWETHLPGRVDRLLEW